MLLRHDGNQVICITQPAHSRVSGQFARAWGNSHFHKIPEEVCLAAELHDLGFLEWEQSPTLNPETGWPHTFMDLPNDAHLALWSTGVEQLRLIQEYAALLASLHYTWLAEKHPVLAPLSERRLQENFVRKQIAIQADLLAVLRKQTVFGPLCGDEPLASYRRCIAVWDWMSLVLGMGADQEKVFVGVPGLSGLVDIKIIPCRQPNEPIRIVPWPFAVEKMRVVFPGRRLGHPYQDQAAMRQDLAAASVEYVVVELAP